jgi:hypothetical protein
VGGGTQLAFSKVIKAASLSPTDPSWKLLHAKFRHYGRRSKVEYNQKNSIGKKERKKERKDIEEEKEEEKEVTSFTFFSEFLINILTCNYTYIRLFVHIYIT